MPGRKQGTVDEFKRRMDRQIQRQRDYEADPNVPVKTGPVQRLGPGITGQQSTVTLRRRNALNRALYPAEQEFAKTKKEVGNAIGGAVDAAKSTARGFVTGVDRLLHPPPTAPPSPRAPRRPLTKVQRGARYGQDRGVVAGRVTPLVDPNFNPGYEPPTRALQSWEIQTRVKGKPKTVRGITKGGRV